MKPFLSTHARASEKKKGTDGCRAGESALFVIFYNVVGGEGGEMSKFYVSIFSRSRRTIYVASRASR